MKRYLAHHPLRLVQYVAIERVASLISSLCISLGPNRRLLEATKILRGSRIGKRALVLGNGPSLSLLDPEKIVALQQDGLEVFATNSFMVNPMARRLTPDFYLLSDPNWFSPGNPKNPPEFNAEILESNRRLSDSLAVLFVPLKYSNLSVFPNETFYFNDSEVFFGKYSPNVLRARRFPSIGGMKAIWLADYMGFETIFIAGIDGDQFLGLAVDVDNKVSVQKRHDHQNVRSSDFHFPSSHSVAHHLYLSHNAFQSFHKFPKDRVINLISDSLVDAFSKKHSLDIFS